MAFDVRAMQNIATAPSTPGERLVGRWVGAVALVVFAAFLPFATLRLPHVAAFVPAVVGAAFLAQALSALLFFVQYRLVRGAQLAALALLYTASAYLTLLYVLTFPGVFSPTGLFHASLQTSAYLSNIEHVLVAAVMIAIALSGDRDLRLEGRLMRLIVCGAIALLALITFGALRPGLPELLLPAAGGSPLYYRFVAPVVTGLYVVAIAVLLRTRLRTVAQTWLLVVAVLRLVEVLAVSGVDAQRYSLYWYLGRSDLFFSASVFLAVFLFKLNDLLIRLEVRNRALRQRTEVAELELAEGELRYRTLANVVPQLIWSASASGEVDYVNDRWIVYTGLDVHETRQRGWRAALDESQPTSLKDLWHQSLGTGLPFSGEYRLREGRTGRLRWFLINAIAVRDQRGEVTRWIGSCTDIDRQKRIEEREAFLARAGDRLSASLDTATTLEQIAELVAGRIALWARVDLLDEEGRFSTAAAASDVAAENFTLRALLGRRASPALETLFGAVLSSREVAVERERRDLVADLPGVRGGSALIVPLTSGEKPLGVLTLVRGERRVPDAEDVAMAREFGRRAAQALDHARLYERERTTADALQRAMLPQALPQLDQVAFSASYSAAMESQRVGGDFYDAFLLPDGRVALTIGDVTGHGLEAAVIMGEIRQALRAVAFERAEPAAILDRASKLLVASGRTVFVTAIFGVLDAQTGLFHYATAGHPAPLIYDGTRLIRLGTSGLPIGLRDEEGVDFAVSLTAPCTLVLFTDGLLEFARDLEDGERRIERAIRMLDADDSDHLAGTIMQRVLAGEQATDDIAILTATVSELPRQLPHEVREWRFHSNDGRTATLVRHDVGELVAGWTGRRETAYESELVFGELFSNVVRHAPGALHVRAAQTPHGAEIVVSDNGPGFGGTGMQAEDLAESGRGLQLVRAIGDGVEIEHRRPGTSIRVSFYRAAPVNAGSSSALSSA